MLRSRKRMTGSAYLRPAPRPGLMASSALDHLLNPRHGDAGEALREDPDHVGVIFSPAIAKPEGQGVIARRTAPAIIPVTAPDYIVFGVGFLNDLGRIRHLVARRFSVGMAALHVSPSKRAFRAHFLACNKHQTPVRDARFAQPFGPPERMMGCRVGRVAKEHNSLGWSTLAINRYRPRTRVATRNPPSTDPEDEVRPVIDAVPARLVALAEALASLGRFASGAPKSDDTRPTLFRA
jgi:hypothetical protein